MFEVKINIVEESKIGSYQNEFEVLNMVFSDDNDAIRVAESNEILTTDAAAETMLYPYFHVPEKYRGYSNCREKDMRNKEWHVEITVWEVEDCEDGTFDYMDLVKEYKSKSFGPDYIFGVTE